MDGSAEERSNPQKDRGSQDELELHVRLSTGGTLIVRLCVVVRNTQQSQNYEKERSRKQFNVSKYNVSFYV